MIEHETFSIRKISLKILLAGIGLVIAFIIFIALISINVGLSHMQQDGFWVPILAGLLSIGGCLWLFFVSSRSIINQMKEKDVINNI